MNATSAARQRSNATPLIAQVLEHVFSDCFRECSNAILRGGNSEPLYQPATGSGQLNVLHYREDFFASALHEVAHWCIAGSARRSQLDFGYWYTPDGRTVSQQRAFEEVEYKPQALEWFFAKACGFRFRISVDNLNAQSCQSTTENTFKYRVVQQAEHWIACGLPRDGGRFFNALCEEYGTNNDLRSLRFSVTEIE